MKFLSNIFRSVPDFKGKRRLARGTFKKEINSFSSEIIAGKYSCRYLVPNLMENIGFDIFINGVYEPNTIEYLDKIIPANGNFLDLGANIGAIIIPLSKLRPDIRSIGVEAAPWIFTVLEENVRMNQLRNVSVYNYALFDKDDIEMDFFSPHDQYGKGSLSPVFSDVPVKVITKTISTILAWHSLMKVDAIKADVEGFEYFVFNGGKELLASTEAPDIIFEFVDWAEQRAMGLSPGSAQRLLLQFGYELFVLDNSGARNPTCVLESGAADMLASKKYK